MLIANYMTGASNCGDEEAFFAEAVVCCPNLCDTEVRLFLLRTQLWFFSRLCEAVGWQGGETLLSTRCKLTYLPPRSYCQELIES